MSLLRGEYTDERNTLIKGWTGAKDGPSKAKAWADVQRWNAKQPPAAPLTLSQLQQATQRANDTTKKYMGVSFNRSTSWIAERDRGLYTGIH